MSQQRLLNRVLDVLEGIRVDYMLTGSWASSMQGQPRSTHDLDLVVNLTPREIPGLVAGFAPAEYYLSEASVAEAVRDRTMFNLLDTRWGDKVDFWMLTGEPWDAARFGRRMGVIVEGREIWVSSPEDTILAKLRWSKLTGGSARQFQDAREVCELQWDVLDLAYLQHWSRSLEVETDWRRLVASLGKE